MIGPKLLALASAISQHEGWLPDNLKSSAQNEESLAFKNNNPGNLRSSPFALGQRSGFAYFYNEEVGRLALLWDLYQKCTGNTVTGLSPKSTLGDLIKVYAPPSENDTEQYIRRVEQITGSHRDDLLETFVK